MANRSPAERPSTVEQLAALLREFIARTVVFNHQVAERLGLNPTDNQCLSLLELYGPMKVSQLGRHLGLTPSAMTGLIDRLERAGFVQRKADPHDRRSTIIAPELERVRAEALRYYGPLAPMMERVYARFEQQQLATVLAFFQAMAEEAAHRDSNGDA